MMKKSRKPEEKRDMSNDLEQPRCSSDDVVHSDLGGSDIAPSGDSAVGAGDKVPLQKEAATPPKRRPRTVRKVEPSEQTSSSSFTVDPRFFVDLGTTLRDMRRAERTHKISSLKIV